VPLGSVAVLGRGQITRACAGHRVPLLEKLQAMPGPLLGVEEEEGTPRHRGGQAGLVPEGALVQGGTAGRMLALGRDTGTSTFNQIILVFKQQWQHQH